MRFLTRRGGAPPPDGEQASKVSEPQVAPNAPTPRRTSLGTLALRLLLHGVFLVVAVGCLVAYEHLKIAGQSPWAIASLVTGAGFAFFPLRDVTRLVLGVEGKTLHVVHALGGLGLVALPVTGVVSGAPVLTHAALAPCAIMGAAQAMMHQNNPRNAAQAAALRRFAESLPEVAQFTSGKNLTSPANAQRAVQVLSDLLAEAQALGPAELDAAPGFQSAIRRVTTRFGGNLGLDVVSLVLDKLAANPLTAKAVPGLRAQLARARSALS